MERTINDIVRENREQGTASQWVCETCGSENVRSRNGSVGFCEDCDGVCTTVEVPDERDDPRADLYAVQ